MQKNLSARFKIFLMGGTKDSINIIKFLKNEYFSKNSSLKYPPYILTTTTTDYGAEIAKNAGSDKVISKPLSKEEIVNILTSPKNKFDIFIDATHPFATNATLTAIESSKTANIPYLRFERPDIDYSRFKNSIIFVNSFKEAGKLINNEFQSKNILHLAGVNTIESVLKFNQINLRNFFVRVLPVKSSIEKCNSLGISGENIIAMQGVFSKEFNKILMKEFKTNVIITKDSGETGGSFSKVNAAYELGIDIILVNRPKISDLNVNNSISNLNELQIFLDKF